MIEIKPLNILDDIEIDGLKQLLMQYGHYMYSDLALVAGKERYWTEMQAFPSKTHTDSGNTFLLALFNEKPAGCVGLRKFDNSACEMKRMFVSNNYRGLKIGEKLCNEIIEHAKQLGYKRILLDTNKEMIAAVKLYSKFGFKEIPAYCINENNHPIYLEKELH